MTFSVLLFIYYLDSIQLQPRIQPDLIISRPPPVRDPNYVQNFSAYERVYTVIVNHFLLLISCLDGAEVD